MRKNSTSIIVLFTALILVIAVYAGLTLDGMIPDQVNDFKIVAVDNEYMEVVELTGDELKDRKYKPLLYQNYNIIDKNGQILDLSENKVEIRHPGADKFINAEASNDGIKILLWPPSIEEKYIFRITKEKGEVHEFDFKPNFLSTKNITKTGDNRFSANGILERAYKLENLDLSLAESIYHILPNQTMLKAEVPGDEFFWLSSEQSLYGSHAILVKQDNSWYKFSFLILTEEIKEEIDKTYLNEEEKINRSSLY